MEIELAGYTFSNAPISKIGNIFMRNEQGEGTEIDEFKIREVLDKLFRETM